MSGEPTVPDRLWTVPNGLSLARLLGVPLFLWLVLGPHADVWAVVVLILAGLSDWLDGKLARALNQTSRIGAVLDPAADRLYILATLAGLVLRHIVPLWLAVLLVARELFVGVVLLIVRRIGYGTLPVHFIGKAATLCLLYAFPLLFLGAHDGAWAEAARILGWAFAIWGTGLYWWGGVLYATQARQLAVRGAESSP
jgi:cardiolipin synthase